MKKLLLTLIFALSFIFSKAEILHLTISGTYYSYNAEVYIPDNTTGELPGVIFIPGNGEVGTDRNLLYVNGPLKFVRDYGWKPNFVIVAVQSPTQWPNYIFTLRCITEVLNNPVYRVDAHKWHLTGLSAGAAAIFDYIRLTPDADFLYPNSIVPFSITTGAQCGDFYANTDYLCGTDLRYSNIPAWGFAGWADSHYEKMKRFFDRLQQAGYNAPWTSYKLPIGSSATYSSSGHCCWNDYYNPNYTENGNNIYSWMMQFNISVPLPVKFVSFQYMYQINSLKWVTATESNVSHFEIEESDNGTDWKSIASIPAKAQEGSGADYTYHLK